MWSCILAVGTALYALFGRNSYYFQFPQAGNAPDQARALSRERGQEPFPAVSLAESLHYHQ